MTCGKRNDQNRLRLDGEVTGLLDSQVLEIHQKYGHVFEKSKQRKSGNL